MSLLKIERIMRDVREIGVKNVKITGGEPLVREDIVDIVRTIKKYGFDDVSLVTNGLLLARYAKGLKEAGLDRLNIGCDSLNSDMLLKNKRNIESGLKIAKDVGFNHVKLNMVVLKGINDEEIKDMIEFARWNRVVLQLIELIRFNVDDVFYEKHFFDLSGVEKELEEKAISITLREIHNRRQYNLGDVVVEVVRPFTGDFCTRCRRIRITADGWIKPCLRRNDNLVEFKGKYSLLEAIRRKGVLYV
jgi:cyclic pyranopterin phosphate synthase